MEAIQFVSQLGMALWNLKVMYDHHIENKSESKELQSFIEDYDHQIPMLQKRFQVGSSNVMGIVALKTLERDIIEALSTLERWSKDKSFFRVFNSAERKEKLGKLHFKVMASVQKSLGIANLSLLLDVQSSQATILESTTELKSLLITSIGNTRGTLPMEVREEVVEASSSSFADSKFWEDILAAVDNHNDGFSCGEESNVYEDPITAELMIDPVVASDGNTYCRWTIINHHLRKNPSNMDEDLTIVIDNLAFRRGLFERFPSQCQIFRQRRKEYRSHALSLQGKGLFGDAVLALEYVLQWSKDDTECIEALQQVQEGLRDMKEKPLEPSVGSTHLQGLREDFMTVFERMKDDQKLCDNLVRDLASANPLDQEGALKYMSTLLEGDNQHLLGLMVHSVVQPLAKLIPSSNSVLEVDVVTILMHLSTISSFKTRGALDPILEVLKKGSIQARERAAAILFNISSDGPSYIGSRPGAVGALVIAFGDGTHEALNKILTQTLFILIVDDKSRRLVINAGVVHILVRLITEQPATLLDEVLPLVESLLRDPWGLFGFRNRTPASAWLDIIASESAVDRERAASILYKLCRGSKQYCGESRAGGAVERIEKLGPFPHSKRLLRQLRPKLSWFPWKK